MIKLICGIIQLISGLAIVDIDNKIGRIFVGTGLFFIILGLIEITPSN